MNPNGSSATSRGIHQRPRERLGMMPHPERLAEGSWRRNGRVFFESIVEAVG